MKWWRDLLGGRPDANSLTNVERRVLEGIVRQHHPNVCFAAARIQLSEWLSVKLGAVAGAPDWLTRHTAGDRLQLTQNRAVGASYLLPKAYGRVELTWPFLPTGTVTVVLDEIVTEISITRPATPDVAVGGVELIDDRPYWSEQQRRFPDLEAVAAEAISFLERRRASLAGRVVLPATGRDVATIGGIRLSPAYRRLLSFANGIRINTISIWGWSPELGLRVESVAGRRWLYAGLIPGGFMFLPVDGDAAVDEVYEFRPARGKPRRSASDLIAVANEALGRSISG